MLKNSRYIVSFQKTCQYLDERIVETIKAEGGAGIMRVPNQPLTVQQMTPPAAKKSSSTGLNTAANTQAQQMAPPVVRGVRSSTGSNAATNTQTQQMAPPAARGVRSSSTGSSAATNTQAQQMAPPTVRGVRSSSRGSNAAATVSSVQPRPPAAGPRQLRTPPLARPQPQVASTSSTTGTDNPWVRF